MQIVFVVRAVIILSPGSLLSSRPLYVFFLSVTRRLFAVTALALRLFPIFSLIVEGRVHPSLQVRLVIFVYILAINDSRYHIIMILTDETHTEPIKQKFFDFFIILRSKSCYDMIYLLEQCHCPLTGLWPGDKI